jgi:hypothetical protein
VSVPAAGTAGGPTGGTAAGAAVPIAAGDVFDPYGDGEPENTGAVPQAFDNDPSTTWSTLEYRGSPAFGNLKDGVGLLLDLGQAQDLGAVTLVSTTPGATVEIRTGDTDGGALDDFDVAAGGEIKDTTDLTFDKPVTARYVLVWVTGLAPSANGFSADIAEVTVHAAA